MSDTGPLVAPAELQGSSTPALRDTIAWVEVDNEVVVLDEVTTDLHLLTPIGGVVLQCLDGASTVDEIADDFAAEFGAPTEVVRADVLALVRDLGERGLLAGVGVEVPADDPHAGHDHSDAEGCS